MKKILTALIGATMAFGCAAESNNYSDLAKLVASNIARTYDFNDAGVKSQLTETCIVGINLGLDGFDKASIKSIVDSIPEDRLGLAMRDTLEVCHGYGSAK
ncbi:hypothetical protein [Hafnia phage Pocis76]|uniref:Lipoprotein n=1 Tax=Hafnia phage Pocis76 TaxID=2831174 RepID=A0A8E7FND5_9CAUD|nr:hypothetical protein [Hafnia phage Pocis76]